ncbi:cob(I)alamin adenosyltransferase [Arboricoccus pini]|uniref:Corrinoid adenosyltransferase n=1 Tax=Arboricoccus pini TaxID=1963835 RepID=A0A212RE15_9PROT|nr:cob(I)yrinic acid a,c-diamide adenosyltransferase [Arboricoccus pini]SNB70458.1 cob(I)alamin adenosyltransferase [Arboricoccus pini]
MIALTRIYTKGGDGGQTSLGDGSRVSKDDLRIEAIGSVDEVNAVIGVARADLPAGDPADLMLARIQNDLFDLGADLCRPLPDPEGRSVLRLLPGQVQRLEAEIDAMNAELEPLTSFVLPGGRRSAAHLHHARTVTRRAERLAVALGRQASLNPVLLHYLNRLSDHLFVLARTLNEGGRADVLWVPGAHRG